MLADCQRGENKWPAYGADQTHTEIFQAALAMGHGRGGRYDHIWDDEMFYFSEDEDPAVMRNRKARGMA